jgi:predicted transcriptional regulator
MWRMISIKVDPRMKNALEKLAKQEFSSVSGILKKAAEKYLLEHDIDWRKTPEKKTKK